MAHMHIRHEGAMGVLKETIHWMVIAEQWLCIIFSAVFMMLMTFQVVMRYAFNNPIYGIEEWVTALMIWYCAMGIVVVYWEKGHAMIGMMTRFMNNAMQKFILLLSEGIVVVTSAIFIWTGFDLFEKQMMTQPLGGVPFNKSIYYALPMIVMGVTMLITGVFRLAETIVTKDAGKLNAERVSLD